MSVGAGGAYSYGYVSAEISIDGDVVPASEVMIRYGVNSVPHAAAKLSVGFSSQGLASGPAVLAAADPRAEVTIDFITSGNGGPGPSWGGTYRVFEGQLGGSREDSVASQSVGNVMEAEHFSAILAHLNKYSWMLHPSSAGDTFRSVDMTSQSGAGGDENRFLAGIHNIKVFNAKDDLWENGVKVALMGMASENRVKYLVSSAADSSPATDAIEVINRINTGDGVLKMAAQGNMLADNFDRAVLEHLASPSSGTTYWDTLLNFGYTWGIGLVPLPDRILYVPMLEPQGSPSVHVRRNEIFSITAPKQYPMIPTRTTAFISQSKSRSGNTAGDDAEPREFAGYADIMDMGGSSDDAYGQLMVTQWPNAYDAYLSVNTAKATLGVTNSVPKTMSNPYGQAAPSAKREYAQYSAMGATVADKMAQSLLAKNRFVGRTLKVTGRLRFDICPGAQVAVDVLGRDRTTPTTLYGCVSEVDLVMNSERPFVATSFTLTHVRSAREQRSGLAQAGHFIFGELFTGVPLAEG